jgi:uncharacterized integral membrane protein
MTQKKNKQKPRQIGRTTVAQKKPLINPRYKNTVWTVVIVVILSIFFIVNNTRNVPESGPYPPTFNPQKAQKILNEN